MTSVKSLESWSVVTVGRVGCFECVSRDYKKSGKLKGLAYVKHDGDGGSLYYCPKHAAAGGSTIVGARLRKSQERSPK